MARRLIFVVLDGVGVGALPDAADYGDAGSDTLGNLSHVIQLRLPYMQQMGLGNITPIQGVPPVADPLCLVGRLAPRSAGKDTTVGHWEHMGLVTERPFPTYPNGFPREVIASFEERIGRRILGNKPASGTAIIAELGAEHLASGRPIVYTSADSVFQIATHVDVVSLEQLYAWCQLARELLQGHHAVARVIARPFSGSVGAFVRTRDRRDFSLEPTGPLYLDSLRQAGVPVIALGKVSEIFAGRGITTTLKVASNDDNLALVTELVQGRSERARFDAGLLFTNLVDFDVLWGHRNDADGFGKGLEAVDEALPAIVAALQADDRLIVTADHGVDPTTVSTDHSREYAPLLFYPRPADTPAAVYEGMFADTGATACRYLTGQDPGLAGSVITDLRPSRRWRRYTSAQPEPAAGAGLMSGRVGPEEAAEAARWLGSRLGPAPEVAVVLGSGLDVTLAESPEASVSYDEVPHWSRGTVLGHAYLLAVARHAGQQVALLRGRVHEYEGFDLSEVQLCVHTLARWGVTRLILTSASGAVGTWASGGPGGGTVRRTVSRVPADMAVVPSISLVTEVLDFQYPLEDGRPARLPGTDRALVEWLVARAESYGADDGAAAPWRLGVHASVPGPQYETPAELEMLRLLGAATVSMSPAAEVRAARESGLKPAVLAVVANSGDTTHDEVLAGAARAREALTTTIKGLLAAWEAARS